MALQRSATGLEALLVGAAEATGGAAARSLRASGAALVEWGAAHREQVDVPAAAAVESLLQVTSSEEIAVMQGLLRASDSLHRWGSKHEPAPVATAQSLLQTGAMLQRWHVPVDEIVSDDYSPGPLLEVRTSLRRWGTPRDHAELPTESQASSAEVPSLLQTSEAEAVRGKAPRIGILELARTGGQVVARGLPMSLSDVRIGEQSVAELVMLGLALGLVALMLQLSPEGHDSLVGKLTDKSAANFARRGALHCCTDRGS